MSTPLTDAAASTGKDGIRLGPWVPTKFCQDMEEIARDSIYELRMACSNAAHVTGCKCSWCETVRRFDAIGNPESAELCREQEKPKLADEKLRENLAWAIIEMNRATRECDRLRSKVAELTAAINRGQVQGNP
jgi:hypothetical protein